MSQEGKQEDREEWKENERVLPDRRRRDAESEMREDGQCGRGARGEDP